MRGSSGIYTPAIGLSYEKYLLPYAVFVSSNEVIPPIDSEEEEESQEGQILTRVHKLRERDRGLVRRKKESVLKRRSSLSCEVCDFDFEAIYGERGRGFIECHHTKALSELPHEGGRIALSDLIFSVLKLSSDDT